MRRNSGARAGLYLAVGGGMLLWQGIKKFRKKRKYEDVPNIDVASAPQGLVELSGFAWCKSKLFNLEGRPISFLAWKLEKLVSSGKNSSWKEVGSGTYPEGFLLQDESGSAWIEMKNADIDAPCKTFLWNKISGENQKRFFDWLGANKLSYGDFPPQPSFFETKYRVRVYEFPVGCPVLAQGSFYTSRKENMTVLPGMSAFKEKFLKLKKNTNYALSLMDVNGDGKISEEEYGLGYEVAAETVARKVANDNSQASVAYVESTEILGHLIGSDNYKLMIANTHESYLIQRLQSWTGSMIIGGALMIAVGICVLASDFIE